MAHSIIQPNPTIRAKIRTGIKSGGRPKAIDHFVSDDAGFNEAFDKPKALIITFPFKHPEECLRTSYEVWGKSVLKCWSNDGELRHTRQDDGSWAEGKCKGTECVKYTGKANGCAVVGRLRFKIPALSPYDLWQIDTRSWNTMNAIAGTLQLCAPIHPEHEFKLVLHEKKSPTGKFYHMTIEPLAFDMPTPDVADFIEDVPEEEEPDDGSE